MKNLPTLYTSMQFRFQSESSTHETLTRLHKAAQFASRNTNRIKTELKVSKRQHARPKSYLAKTDDFFLIHLDMVFCTMTNKCTQLFHKLSHCYMFRHYRVILRQLVINTLPSYTSISNAAVGNTILYNKPTNAHNYFTNYHTATCFDTIMSSSDSL